MSVFQDFIIGLNRIRNRLRPLHVRPENLLLLVPHCLQKSTCGWNIIHDLDQCAHCGQCNITDLLKLRDEFGIRCNLASGGQQALEFLRHPDVKAVVAVACEKELADGIRAAAPKPVITICNECPEGPCKNTRVDIEAVRTAIQQVIKNAGDKRR